MLLQSVSKPDCNTKGFQQVRPGSALKRLKRNVVSNHPNDKLQLPLQFLKLLKYLLHKAIQGNLLSNLHLLRTVAQVLKRSVEEAFERWDEERAIHFAIIEEKKSPKPSSWVEKAHADLGNDNWEELGTKRPRREFFSLFFLKRHNGPKIWKS